jgi:hypothetical protein
MNIILSEKELFGITQQQAVKGGGVLLQPQGDKRRERPGTSPTTTRSSGKR